MSFAVQRLVGSCDTGMIQGGGKCLLFGQLCKDEMPVWMIGVETKSNVLVFTEP